MRHRPRAARHDSVRVKYVIDVKCDRLRERGPQSAYRARFAAARGAFSPSRVSTQCRKAAETRKAIPVAAVDHIRLGMCRDWRKLLPSSRRAALEARSF